MKASEIIVQFLDGKLLDNPEELSRALIILSSYLYTLGCKIIESEIAYAQKWTELKPNQKTDKSCDIAMKFQPEYAEMEHSKFAYKTTLECIRSVKHRLKILQDEAKNLY